MTRSQLEADEACVLIVDDEEDVRESLRDVVEMAGCSAILAANAADALELLADRRPCLMVLDLLMPGMTGAEMLEKIRRDPALLTMPVVGGCLTTGGIVYPNVA
jgi:CheY-like chemotaxis protein